MKATISPDGKIIKLSVIGKGVEVGNIPRGTPLDRFRWDGTRLVDLAKCKTFYVEPLGNDYFDLHVAPIRNSQKVNMSYEDRKRLKINSAGQICLATVKEQENKEFDQLCKGAGKVLLKNLGNDERLYINLIVMVMSLIVYARRQPDKLKLLFDRMIPHIKDAAPPERYEQILMQAAKELGSYFREYHRKIDLLNKQRNGGG